MISISTMQENEMVKCDEELLEMNAIVTLDDCIQCNVRIERCQVKLNRYNEIKFILFITLNFRLKITFMIQIHQQQQRLNNKFKNDDKKKKRNYLKNLIILKHLHQKKNYI
jgi:hypothetical protein